MSNQQSLSERIPQVTGLQCVICGKRYSLDDLTYTCPDCGQVGTLDVVLNPGVVWADRQNPEQPRPNVWDEERFLPIATDMPKPSQTIPLPIGGTPYYPRVAEGDRWRLPRHYAVKDDGKNPTGSFKDRASAMVVHHALTIGAPVVATASTGNAAAALSGICASIPHLQAVIFVPAAAPPAKIAQLLVYGAKVILVDGPYDDAFDICWEACQEFGWYNRSTGVNPFTSEGKKTIAWEIAFSGYHLPDAVFISVGDGSIIGSTYKGFADLKKLGWLDRIPRIIGVQSEGSAALVRAWEKNLDPREMTPQPADTLADSISASLPRDRAKALRAARESNGAFIAVPDSDILAAIPALAQQSGVFAEPAGATTYAGYLAALRKGIVTESDNVLLLNTGSGLKDIKGAMQSVSGVASSPVKPTMAAVREAVSKFALSR
jgi:threonine synthase